MIRTLSYALAAVDTTVFKNEGLSVSDPYRLGGASLYAIRAPFALLCSESDRMEVGQPDNILWTGKYSAFHTCTFTWHRVNLHKV